MGICKFSRPKATTGGKMLYLEPQVVALIIFLPGHFYLMKPIYIEFW